MKQTITALLLALALVLGLSGCTARKDNQSDKDNSGTTQNGTMNNGAQNGTNGNTNNGTMNGGTNSGDANNGTANNNARSRSYNSYAQPGVNGPTSSDSVDDLLRGRSYEEMLRNGRVHDTDGILTDGENSVSQW